jgi:hypothetical protein
MGWPVVIPPQPGYSPPPIYNSASIGDINSDGQKEIVVGVDDGTAAGYPSHVFCFKPDGTNCPGFPVGVSRQGYRSKAVLVDIDGNGNLEIVIGKEAFELNVYNSDGTLFSGYPIGQGARGIAVGDINLDQRMDMIFAKLSIRGFDLGSATALPNFPLTDPTGLFGFSDWKAPNICDLSDDAGMEIVAGASNASGVLGDGKLFAFNIQGQVVDGFPSSLLYHRELNAGCTVNDLDTDGDIEICCGGVNNEATGPTQSTVYCWDSPHPYNLDNVDWAMDGFDLGHTGRWRRLYHISKTNSQLAVAGCPGTNPCYLPPDGSLIAVEVTAVREHGGAKPAGQDVRYSRTLGCGNYEGPVVDHGDGTYTRLLRAPTADCTTDVHAWVNEFKLQDGQQIVFTNSCFQPPAAFHLTAPANKASHQPLTVTLSWEAAGSFPNAPTGYDLYFGSTSNPPVYASNIAGTQWTVAGLTMQTTYFWKVVARNACGATGTPLWAFTTIPCTIAPRPFTNLSPPHGAVNQPLTVDLAWQASTQAASYEVYFGVSPSSLSLRAAVSGTRYAAEGLCPATTYYWQIVAVNPCGRREGAVWSFTTGAGDGPGHPRPVGPP